MRNVKWKVLAATAAALAISGVALAKDVRELSWDDLLPPLPESVSPDQLLRHGSGADSAPGGNEPWDMEEESFEDVFATPCLIWGHEGTSTGAGGGQLSFGNSGNRSLADQFGEISSGCIVI